MPRRRSYPALRQGQRRKSSWFAGPDETAATTVAAGSADLQSVLNAVGLQYRPFTIVRTVGQIFISSDQAAGGELFHGAFGLAVVSEQAAAAGTGSLPTPITEQGSEFWLLYQLVVAQGFQAAGESASYQVFNFDSRAMRKVDEGQTVVSVFENGSGSAGIDYLARFRYLVKMH